MAAISDYAENELLDHVLGTGSYTMPSQVYLSLYTSNPTDADTGNEVSGDGYAREAIDFGAASGGTASNTAAITFTANGGDWGTITHIGLHDASTSGNLLWHGSLNSSRIVNDGDELEFAIGDVTVTLA